MSAFVFCLNFNFFAYLFIHPFQECKKFPGFLRLSISEAQADRKFARRGWATYERTVPIREICWALNSVKVGKGNGKIMFINDQFLNLFFVLAASRFAAPSWAPLSTAT